MNSSNNPDFKLQPLYLDDGTVNERKIQITPLQEKSVSSIKQQLFVKIKRKPEVESEDETLEMQNKSDFPPI